jgi:two-component system, LuxR family, sensor kinase FixL
VDKNLQWGNGCLGGCSAMPRNGDDASVEVKKLRNGEREGVLARIIATTQDSVIFIDAHARVVEFNRSAELTFGYQAREVIGQNVSLLMPEPYRAEHDVYLKNYEKTRRARAIGTIRTVKGRRKDGETFPLELSITELPGDSPIRYAAFLRDISEKTALQAQLLERERLASLGMAASILAHEIGNPLNNIYLEAQLLERRLKKSADVNADRSKNIMAEVSRLVRLLDEFRSVSRAHQRSFEPCDLAEIADYTAAQVETQARTNGVSIQSEAGRSAIPVLGSPDKLRQVALNLAKNAIEAMPDGGTLHIGAQTTGALAVLTFADTGTGLPDGIDILEAFKTTKAHGTGLGLAIVKQIVTSHRGALSWDSSPGKGATFRVALPLLE